MSTILVTGGAGFIGSAVVREIITATSDNVVIIDKLTYAGNLMSLAPVARVLLLNGWISAIAPNWIGYFAIINPIR